MRERYRKELEEGTRICEQVFSPEQREIFKQFQDKPGAEPLETHHLKNGVLKRYRSKGWVYIHWPPPVPGRRYKYLTLDYELISENEARILILTDEAAAQAEDEARQAE